MVAQHLPGDFVRPSSGLEEPTHTMEELTHTMINKNH